MADLAGGEELAEMEQRILTVKALAVVGAAPAANPAGTASTAAAIAATRLLRGMLVSSAQDSLEKRKQV